MIDPADYRAVYDAATPELRQVLFALKQTGARPGEICRLTAADCRFARGVIVYADHKTVKKTGKTRFIPMTEPLKTMLVQLAEKYPEGTLFRTPKGAAWGPSHVACGNLRENSG